MALSVRRGAGALVVGLALMACSPTSAPPEADAGEPPDAGPGPDAGPPPSDGGACELTLCLTGAISRTDGSNHAFNIICDDPSIQGLVQECDLAGCYNTFNSFLVDVKTVIYPPLFKALDTNGDGKVDALDAPCQVTLLGFSWGGASAVQLAQALVTDPNVAPARQRVDRVFAMDPFQTGISELVIPVGVDHYWEFRHSIVPAAGDCSSGAPLGPYKGLVPHCYADAGSSCIDYDYSLSPTVNFPANVGGSFLGEDVGHCDVPAVAGPAVLAILKGQNYPELPVTVPVAAP